jgi:signal transduction histidine kinase
VPGYISRDRHVSSRRLLVTGVVVAALTGLLGGVLEWWRFGADDRAAAAKVEAMVRQRFDEMTDALSRVASALAANSVTVRALDAEPEDARALFDRVAAARAGSPAGDDISITIYNRSGEASAWVGRPSDTFPRDRIDGPTAFFVIQSPLGLRLVHMRPVEADGRRLGTVAAEHSLSSAPAPATMAAGGFTLATPIAPVSLRMRWEGAGEGSTAGNFLLRAASGDPLTEAAINPADLRHARTEWRRRVFAVVLAILSAAVLLLIGPALDRRLAAPGSYVLSSSIYASALLIAGTTALLYATSLALGGALPTGATLAYLGFGTAALVAIWATPVVRLRAMLKPRRRSADAAPGRFAARQLLGGLLATALLVLFEYLLSKTIGPNTVDLRQFSFHPLTPSRLALLLGVLGLQVAGLWAATLIFVASLAPWRVRRAPPALLPVMLLWLVPAVIAAFVARRRGWALPATALIVSTAAAGTAALLGQRLVTWYRHTTVAARIFGLFVAFLVPALLLYPSVNYFSERAVRNLIESRYAPEAQDYPETLQKRMAEAMAQVDAMPALASLMSGANEEQLSRPRTESAFLVWNQTVLARERLTSAVELYDRRGSLISRFALNFPEYTGTAQPPQGVAGCDWDQFVEVQRFGSEERRILHAHRHICVPRTEGGPPDRVLGTIVVHVMFDYRALPFITSQSPYFELFRLAGTGAPREGTPSWNVDVAIYGWGLRPIYTSGGAAWPITDALFARIYDTSRTPFWTRIPRGDQTYEVHFSNDRVFIYAIGYPSLTLFDRFVHFAEVTTLGGVAFGVVLLGTAVFTRVSRERPRVGRALLREIRASFYRKLFLAFVLASVIPVGILAFVIRAYFKDLLLGDVQAEAARTVAVAQRVIEQSDALLGSSPTNLASLSDNVMVWISQVIDQDVNIFDGPRLSATSQADLFSSGLLPTRTPDDVYRAIVIDGLPSFVEQDQIGTFPYLIAAAPARAAGHETILTVPLVNRQREIEREIDDLDRGVHLAALFFILLGSAIGLSLAERIADPVRRLTRATHRIARGDFDARIAVKSADELKRLVDAFNSMAAELKAQRAQLERTHRLEAWAEMARQVAHEIKNPLTPIQLSAEHLRRVHADRRQPLGPVLEECVSSILNQVRLLRQISAEFSSFASSPTARPAPVDVPALVAEVVDPYRTGLEGRIRIENRAVGPLPPVRVDRTLIARAMSNIVENALHAMPGKGELSIDASAIDGFVVLEIQDSGVGMDEEALGRVFEPYFSTKTTGTGLGLPIARRNVELNGGAIEVTSEKGVGTTVKVKLPLA